MTPLLPRSPARPQSVQRGFTLIEILAALMLLGVVLPVAMRGVSLALAASDTARHTTEAAGLAETKLNELTVAQAWATSGETGDFGPDWPGYRWTMAKSIGDFDTTVLTLSVIWAQAGRERRVTLSTLAYDAPATTGVAGVGATP